MLEQNKSVLIKNERNEQVRRIEPIGINADNLFYASTGVVLLRTVDGVHLCDVERQSISASCKVSKVSLGKSSLKECSMDCR